VLEVLLREIEKKGEGAEDAGASELLPTQLASALPDERC